MIRKQAMLPEWMANALEDFAGVNECSESEAIRMAIHMLLREAIGPDGNPDFQKIYEREKQWDR